MPFGIKINATDVLFSLLVRERDGWTCVRCKRKHEKTDNTSDNSHYWGRGRKSVRWDFDNCDTLCKLPCHAGPNSQTPKNFGWEYQKQIAGYNGSAVDGEYTQFKKKQLGKKFDELMIRAHTPKKADEKSLRIGFKLELKKIEREKNSQIFGSR